MTTFVHTRQAEPLQM